MARTKKAQEPIAEAVVDSDSQTGSEWEAEMGTLDGLPQTDLENSQTEVSDGILSQTDTDGGQSEVSDGISSQTDLEGGQSEVSDSIPSQTGPDDDWPEISVDIEPQTDSDGSKSEVGGGVPPQTGSELDDYPLAAQSGMEHNAVPQAGSEAPLEPGEPDTPPNDPGHEAEQPTKKLRMPGRGPRVVSIDAQRSVETDADRLRNDLLDLIESMKGKKILSDTIQGVERPSPNSELCYAVIYHGDFKVIIPVLEVLEEPEDYRNQPKGDVLHYMLNKRLGAEIDYVIKGVDPDSGVAAGSRLEAMAMKRKEYYFRTDRDGNYQIYEGIRAEARVVSVIRAGIFVDLFGVECYIPLRELSYQRWMDASAHYQPGHRVLVKVLEVDRSDRSRPRIAVSVKQAGDNPYEKALQKYVVNCLYVGTVSVVDLTGVFVALDGGIDCLCSHPKRGRPPRGARVTVRVLGIDKETNRIWGAITHMSTTR